MSVPLKMRKPKDRAYYERRKEYYLIHATVLILLAVGFLDRCLCACHKRNLAFSQDAEDALQEAWCKSLKR